MKAHLLEALHKQEISFDTFARKTNGDWTRLANHLWNQWRNRIPSAITEDDIKQELLMNAWMWVGKYEPGRASLRTYVLFMACSCTLRWIHCQRNAIRRNGKAESRFPIPFARMGVKDSWVEDLFPVEVDYDGLIDARSTLEEGLSTALQEAGGIDVWCLAAFKLSGYDLRRAGEALFEEPGVRRYSQWGSAKDATAQVQSSVCAWLAEKAA